MKPKYTAKVYFDDGSCLEKHGDHVNQLIVWMRNQGQDQLTHSTYVSNSLFTCFSQTW